MGCTPGTYQRSSRLATRSPISFSPTTSSNKLAASAVRHFFRKNNPTRLNVVIPAWLETSSLVAILMPANLWQSRRYPPRKKKKLKWSKRNKNVPKSRRLDGLVGEIVPWLPDKEKNWITVSFDVTLWWIHWNHSIFEKNSEVLKCSNLNFEKFDGIKWKENDAWFVIFYTHA